MKTELSRLVQLFQSGVPIIDIAKKTGVTKQAVSERLKRYYKKKRPMVFHDTIKTKLCTVCGSEEVLVSNRKPIHKHLFFHPTQNVERIICRSCKDNHIYRCRTCGAIGYIGADLSKTSANDKIQTTFCKICLTDKFKKWRSENPDKVKEIQRRYREGLGL